MLANAAPSRPCLFSVRSAGTKAGGTFEVLGVDDMMSDCCRFTHDIHLTTHVPRIKTTHDKDNVEVSEVKLVRIKRRPNDEAGGVAQSTERSSNDRPERKKETTT